MLNSFELWFTRSDFFLFRKELEQLQEKFHLKSLKEDIQKNYIRRDDLEVEFEKIASSVGGELDFRQSLEKNVDEIVERSRGVLEERCLSAPELKRFADQIDALASRKSEDPE